MHSIVSIMYTDSSKTEKVGYKPLIRECIDTKAKYVSESNLYSKENPSVEEHRKQSSKEIHASYDANLYSFYFCFYCTFAYFTLPFHLQMTLILIPTRERTSPSANAILSATNFHVMPNFYQALFP